MRGAEGPGAGNHLDFDFTDLLRRGQRQGDRPETLASASREDGAGDLGSHAVGAAGPGTHDELR